MRRSHQAVDRLAPSIGTVASEWSDSETAASLAWRRPIYPNQEQPAESITRRALLRRSGVEGRAPEAVLGNLLRSRVAHRQGVFFHLVLPTGSRVDAALSARNFQGATVIHRGEGIPK